MNSFNNQTNNFYDNLTLSDIVNFIKNAKFFLLIGLALGLSISTAYLISSEKIYETKLVIKVPSITLTNNKTYDSVTADEVIEYLNLSISADNLLKKIDFNQDTDAQKYINDSLKSVYKSKDGRFIYLTAKGKSVSTSEILTKEVGQEIINIITTLNNQKISFLKLSIIKNNNLLNYNKSQNITLKNATLNLELALELFNSDLPQIIDGPRSEKNPISPKITPILILGGFLGLIFGLFFYVIRHQPLTKLDNHK